MALKGNQHKIDKNKNNKIDAQDFKILRGEKKMKEESEQEETILEYESKEGVYRHKGTYGYEGKGAEHGETDYKEKEKEEKPKKGYGARQNYVRSKKVSGKTYESFTAMLDDYKEQGLKGLFEAWKKKSGMKEEVEQIDEEVTVKKTFNDKHESEHEVYHNGKRIGYVVHDKKTDTHTAYHKPASHDKEGHANDYEEIDEYHDHDDAVNRIKKSAVSMKEEVEQIEEREMTDAEMKKREEVVKSMKKNLSGFKQRYGDKAKNVMYATATKIAKKD
jgi:hypothetical protein